MAASDSTNLKVERRQPEGSRATRRLRRSGRVPGVVYGGGDDPITFEVDARVLRNALAHGGAVIDLSVEGGTAQPVVVKDEQHHPVTGSLLHVDLLRVRLDRPIEATTILELVGGEEAPGVKEGGVLEQVTRELNIEALPTAIPDTIEHDVSAMEMNDTLTLAAITAPDGVSLLDDLEETVIATLSPPRVEEEPEEEIEEETELVGEDGEPIEGEAAEGEAEAPAEGGGEAEGDSGGE
jgi:large subunit ribosomal protein L25